MEPIRGKQEILDPLHRYKMHTIIFQKEKTKTCITNLDKIAEDIKIPNKDLIVSYIKKRLAVSMTIKNNVVIITNKVDTKSIQQALYEFIEYFILCKQCILPELTYFLDTNHLCVYCRGCGHISAIESNLQTDKIIEMIKETLAKAKKIDKS